MVVADKSPKASHDPDDGLSRVAGNVEHYRKLRGFSQAELSTRAGLANTAVNDLIRNPDRSPRLDTLEKLAVALDISVWQLISGPEGFQPASTIFSAGDERIRPFGLADLRPREREYMERVCEAFAVDPATVQMAETQGWEAACLGFVPGTVIVMLAAADRQRQVVAVRYKNSGVVRLKYCVDPWLFGFEAFGRPVADFISDPSIEILGVVRRHSFGPSAPDPKVLDQPFGIGALGP